MTSLAGERPDAGVAGRLEVVDAPCAELDRELHSARLRELVGVEPQRQPLLGAGREVAARLRGVERSLLEEDVSRLGDPGRLGEHLGERELEVRVGVGELGRNRVRAEPRWDSPRVAHRAELCELGVAVEPVAGLPLERGRPRRPHPGAVPLDRGAEIVLRRRSRCPDGREDPAAGRVELLVGRAARAQLELPGAVPGEAQVRVTVDEARDRCPAAPVHLDDLAVDRAEVAHPPHLDDDAVARRGRTRPRRRPAARGPRRVAAPRCRPGRPPGRDRGRGASTRRASPRRRARGAPRPARMPRRAPRRSPHQRGGSRPSRGPR